MHWYPNIYIYTQFIPLYTQYIPIPTQYIPIYQEFERPEFFHSTQVSQAIEAVCYGISGLSENDRELKLFDLSSLYHPFIPIKMTI
jgi:hypothetical protein